MAQVPPFTLPSPAQFKCSWCGAGMAFDPASGLLKCRSCGNELAVDADEGPVAEQDYAAQLTRQHDAEPTVERLTHRCQNCGAEVTLPDDTTAGTCPFCGGGIVAAALSTRQVRPRSLLPFAVTQGAAAEAFRAWVAGRWFAPSELKRRAEASAVRGAYLPAWTYDANTASAYTGERGDDYTDTESYTEVENGQTVTKTREVTKTRWTTVSGRVANSFDDVLVMASTSVPGWLLDALTPWDLAHLVPFGEGYLSGFVAESYRVSLAEGFERARQIMAGTVRSSVEQDIGGDHQRVGTVDTRYADVRFKHLLLPVWISAYRYGGRTFRFVVNARTGEVQGERPYSPWKIALLVLLIAAVVATVILLTRR